jgi:hypothetical protein
VVRVSSLIPIVSFVVYRRESIAIMRANKGPVQIRALMLACRVPLERAAGGDAWDRKLRREIHDCALFVPGGAYKPPMRFVGHRGQRGHPDSSLCLPVGWSAEEPGNGLRHVDFAEDRRRVDLGPLYSRVASSRYGVGAWVLREN